MKEKEYLVTYFCTHCGYDYARHNASKIKCFYCESITGQIIVDKEELTSKALVGRMKFVSERAIQHLIKAYEFREDEEEEVAILKAGEKMAALKKKINELD